VLGENQAMATRVDPVGPSALAETIVPIYPGNSSHSQPTGLDQVQFG
jgi:hypothetical protein